MDKVALSELKRAVERYACHDANKWQTDDVLSVARPDTLRALIAEIEQQRAVLASVDGGVDLPQLEACAELVASLDASGPTDALRRRVMLLADWQRVRKLPSPPEAVKP